MHWTVIPDAGRFLVVRWANGAGTIECDCPSERSARREAGRLNAGPPAARGAPIDPQDMRYPPGEAGEQLSLLVD
jgi:hypothetical protein